MATQAARDADRGHLPPEHDEEGTLDIRMVLFLVLFWCGPIGVGVLLMGLGVFYRGKAQARKAE